LDLVHAELQPLRIEPGANGLDEFGLALERQPVSSRQGCHDKIVAGSTHGISDAAAVNVTEAIPLAVDEQYGLSQAPAVWRGKGVRDVSGVIQVP
jgi:hypothetical protein